MKYPKFLVAGLLGLVSLSSCGFFATGNESYYIEDVSSVKNSDGSTTLTFTFSDPETPDMVIEIPAGVDGNGIEDITHVLDTNSDPDRVVITISYTDPSKEDTVISVPVIQGEAGNGIYNVTYTQISDPDDEHYLDIAVTIAFTDPERPSVTFYIPHGNGIASISEDPERWSEETGYYYIVTFEDGSEVSLLAPQGETGNGISDIAYEDGKDNDIVITISLTDGTSYEISVPKSNNWHVGSGNPAPDLGYPGDLYLDMSTGNVHQKNESGSWVYQGNINFGKTTYSVVFIADPGHFLVNGIEVQTLLVSGVVEGSYLTSEQLQVPVYEGHSFEGYWTCPGEPGPFDAKLDLLTPIEGNMTFYAHWSALN